MDSIDKSDMNTYDYDAENNKNNNRRAGGDGENVAPFLESQTGPGSLKINNTTIVFKPNTGKIDLKLFVGQIPKDWDEAHVTDFFSKYGEILESQIIKDGATNQSKGCAFVKFASMTKAEEAIKHLTSKEAPVHLPGVSNPIQLRWADGEEQRLGLSNIDPKNATKLFVGSIPLHAIDENLRDVFQTFGTVEEVNIMRKPDGSSKGCAFIKYQLIESALLAIRGLNAQAYILNSDQPIEVRFAENKKKFPATTAQPAATQPGTTGSYPGMYQPHSSNYYQSPWGMPPKGPTAPTATFIRYHTAEGTPYFYNTISQKTQWEEPPAYSLVYVEEWGNAPYYISPSFDKHPPMPTAEAGGQPGVKKQGPAGANLFVFHLPNEWKDHDLQAHFSRFGAIISCRVMTDKQTGRSKGFGFISYDNPVSAKMAIDEMNGYQVGQKRLKVSIKKGDDDDNVPSMANRYHPY